LNRRRFLALLFVALTGTASISTCQTLYFPAKIFSDDAQLDKFVRNWYGEQLSALKEPSLLALANDHTAQSYRFLWLRSFHHPVAVRLDVKADGSATLTTKKTSGAGGYKPGRLTLSTSTGLTKLQTDAFLKKVDAVRFWDLPSVPKEPNSPDGAEWIIEGVKNGQYHLAERQSPTDGAIFDLGRILAIHLARLKIPKREMY